ncbi:hypothetical protein ACFQ22_02290 [Lentilactobacillus raoultii]|uniref:Uncharacterized protein n=1 Tax=Lentilactobacillus raoultii TaxID=1987503 RepID=A0ABW3PJQ5_9LACO|nr:hypothetical protein [Lentilactobacillus raoultii]
MTSDHSKAEKELKQSLEDTSEKQESKGKVDVPNQEATDKDKAGAPAWNDESPDTEFNDPRKSDT